MRRLAIYSGAIGILAVLAGIGLLGYHIPSICHLCITGASVVIASGAIIFVILNRKG